MLEKLSLSNNEIKVGPAPPPITQPWRAPSWSPLSGQALGHRGSLVAVQAVLGDQRGGWWRNQHLCIGYSPQNLVTTIAVKGISAHLLTTNRLQQGLSLCSI